MKKFPKIIFGGQATDSCGPQLRAASELSKYYNIKISKFRKATKIKHKTFNTNKLDTQET